MKSSSTQRTRTLVTIKWQIETTLSWAKSNKPSKQRIEDILADETPSSVLNIEAVESEEAVWNEKQNSWIVSGTVGTIHTATIEDSATATQVSEIVDELSWIGDREFKYEYDISDIEVWEETVVKRPVTRFDEEELKMQLD